jgi:hypothetical protein
MRIKPITEEYFKMKKLFEESLETKSLQDKYKQYAEVNKRFDTAYKDLISIINSNNPFSYLIENSHNELHEIHLMYQKFDKLRNGISASSSKIQKQFESYLLEAEELIIEVRNLSESLAETGVELDSVNESKIGDIIKIIKKEIVNFKKWITKKIKTMNKLYTILKEDIEMIEKEIQKEFNIK